MRGIQFEQKIPIDTLDDAIIKGIAGDTEIQTEFTKEQIILFRGYVRLFVESLPVSKWSQYESTCGRLIDDCDNTIEGNETNLSFRIFTKNGSFLLDFALYKHWDILTLVENKIDGKHAFYDTHLLEDGQITGTSILYLISRLILHKT